jgi:hypothetical protein
MENETLMTDLLRELTERVSERLFDTLNDTIADELLALLEERGIEDEDNELLYDLHSRVYLGFN